MLVYLRNLSAQTIDPVTTGAWQGSHCSADLQVTGMTRSGKILKAQTNSRLPALEADALTTRPTRRLEQSMANHRDTLTMREQGHRDTLTVREDRHRDTLTVRENTETH